MPFVAVVVLLLSSQVEKPAEAADQTPSIAPIGLFTASIGASFGADHVLPSAALTASLGVRIHNIIGIVAIAHGRIGLVSTGDGSLHLYGLGAGVRLGARSHVTVGVSPTLAVFELPNLAKTVGGVSILANLVLCVGENFALLLQPVIDFAGGQVIGSATLGAGVTF